ncbi:unnamed protein product [Brassica rapa subsp. narinosa]
MTITMKTLITFVFTILFLGFSVHCRTITSAVTPGYGELNTDICFTVLSPCNWRYPHGEEMCDGGCRRDHKRSGYCDTHGRCCCVF